MSDLPPEILSIILQHIPHQHRLSHCALVTPTWTRQAHLDITDMTLQDATPEACQSLQQWLQRCGQQVSSLSIAAAPAAACAATSSAHPITGQQVVSNSKYGTTFQLPGSQLQHLHTLSVQNFSCILVDDSTELEQPCSTATAAAGNSSSEPNSTSSTFSTQGGSSNCGGSLLAACIPVPLLNQLRSLCRLRGSEVLKLASALHYP